MLGSIDRARVTRELPGSEERLRAIYDGTYEYIGLLTPDGTLLEANRASLEFAGNTREDVVGRPFWETPWFTATPGAPEVVRQAVTRAAAGEFVRFEATVRRPSGECPTFDISFYPVRNERGEVVLIVPEGRNITELKRAEERFRQVIDSMPQLVWAALPDGYHDLYNKQWFEYTGLSYEDTKGEGWNAVFNPDGQPRAWARWRHSLQTGEHYEIEYRCRRFDGQYRWFLGRATPIFDEQGRIIRCFGTCTDIHDQKEAEAALRRANRELEEFSYVASHDLQEPLRMVNIYTQLILKRLGSDAANLEQYAGFVRQGVNRMETLIHDLLAYSRATHIEERSIGKADLSAAFSEALSVLKNSIEESGAVITAHSLPTVRGDTPQMAHVFQNLLSNALKYRKLGTALKIHISVELDGDRCIVCMRDNGIGFEQQYAERIFGLFKRLHNDEYPGTGLGLAICQRIVERYGGRMWAESSPGERATFRFSLPHVEAA